MGPGDLLTTTQAAKQLHCSRQHVVDLCDNGTLPYVKAGKHRRIRQSDVDTLLNPPARREDERSLWLNIALAAKLVADPEPIIAAAKERLQWLRGPDTVHTEPYFQQWEDALDAGPDAVLAIMTDRSERGQVLRSASPMTGLGLLDPQERTKILTSHRSHWRRTHQEAS